jgi:hypothetical protein
MSVIVKLTLTERQLIVAELPWVTRVFTGGRCDALKSGSPLKAYWDPKTHLRQTDPEIIDKYRCSYAGRWKFEPLDDGYVRASAGTFCWMHVMYHCVYGTPSECDRTNTWLRANHPELFADDDERR